MPLDLVVFYTTWPGLHWSTAVPSGTPTLKKHMHMLEMVQRRAARFVLHRYVPQYQFSHRHATTTRMGPSVPTQSENTPEQAFVRCFFCIYIINFEISS